MKFYIIWISYYIWNFQPINTNNMWTHVSREFPIKHTHFTIIFNPAMRSKWPLYTLYFLSKRKKELNFNRIFSPILILVWKKKSSLIISPHRAYESTRVELYLRPSSSFPCIYIYINCKRDFEFKQRWTCVPAQGRME